MCGIAGYLSYKSKINREDLEKMTLKLSHRGPDASGYFQDEFCGLGHRRLSIIDLSDRAHQPMTSSNDRFVIVYNGEIYNYQEIGAHLKEGSVGNTIKNFKTSSDTEIILESFSSYGVDFVNQLNGMFAIAIYDKTQQELYLFRDRLGIKPVFYYWDGIRFAFASELKSLLVLPELDLSINENAVSVFLHLGFIPAPESIYKFIKKMMPGSWIKVTKQGITESKYWSLKQKFSNSIITDKSQAMVKLSDLLSSSVQYQLKSDVPFGVFLSGGIDSSLITAQAVSLSSVKVNTFSIGFEENSHNESQYAKAVANYLGTNHHEFLVSYKDAIRLIEPVFEAFDEPFADASAIPTTLVSKLAKDYVTVTLSGEGGDELFLGYGSYKWADRISHPLSRLASAPLKSILNTMSSRYQRISRLLDLPNKEQLQSHIFSQEQYFFSKKELQKLLLNPYCDKPFNLEIWDTNTILTDYQNNFNPKVKNRKLSAMENQALFDLTYYLPDDLLTKVDRCSMQYSIETRVPYLDHRLVEFALNLSPNLKYYEGETKYILKQVLYQHIPKKLFDRPKQGFSIPLNKWLKKELSYLIDEYLSPELVTKLGLVNNIEVQKLVRQFRFENMDFLHNRLWVLIMLHRWFKKNVL